MSTVVAVARTPRPSAVRAASFVAEPVPPLAIGSGALPLKNVFNVLAKLPRISAITLRMALSTLPAGQPVLMLMPSTVVLLDALDHQRSEEHTSELQSLMRISYAVFCLKKNKNI